MDKWQSVGQSQHNVLNEFYKHPERFAYTFQNYVFVTRMLQVSTPLHLLLCCLCIATCSVKLCRLWRSPLRQAREPLLV